MSKTETKIIDGMEVTVVQFPPRKGFRMGVKLLRTIAPALLGLESLEGIDLGSLTMESQVEIGHIVKLAPLIGLAVESLDDLLEANPLLQDQVLSSTSVNKDGERYDLVKTDNIDKVFADSLVGYVGTMRFAVEVNFGEFFGDALAGGAAPSSSPATESPSG